MKSMMEFGKTVISSKSGQKVRERICKACGKEGRMSHITNHIEKDHVITGVAITCDKCGKDFK